MNNTVSSAPRNRFARFFRRLFARHDRDQAIIISSSSSSSSTDNRRLGDLVIVVPLSLERTNNSVARWDGQRKAPWMIKGQAMAQNLTLTDGSAFQAPAMVAIAPTGPNGFMMGSPENERGRAGDEKQHQVVIARAFAMSQTRVTSNSNERSR